MNPSPIAVQIVALALSCGLAVAQSTHTYSTNFPATENPISEGGLWVNGGTDALDWTDMRTTSGFAFGTQSGTNPAQFDDSIAVLTGAWDSDQTAQATIKIGTPITAGAPCYQESEILLRANLSAHSAKLYEVNVGQRNDSRSYINIVRWNGPLGSYTTLLNVQGTAYGVNTGDVLKASIVGSTITAYINGVQKAQVVDTSYASGNPGMGMYLQDPSLCGSGISNFGFSNYAAASSSSAPPPTPQPCIKKHGHCPK